MTAVPHRAFESKAFKDTYIMRPIARQNTFVGLALGFLRVRPFLRPISRSSRIGGWAGLSLPSEEVGRKRSSEAERPRLPRCRRGGRCPHGAAWAEQPCGSHAVPGPSHRDRGARGGRRPAHPQPHPSRERRARVRGRAPARESTPGPARPLPGCGRTPKGRWRAKTKARAGSSCASSQQHWKNDMHEVGTHYNHFGMSEDKDMYISVPPICKESIISVNKNVVLIYKINIFH
ncbi:uncharacterized protein LOC103677455 [Ursus maritimus]|uniref:Uncharacterized protein LOC103677455 n=1 Tax=Ursus maritimus TaxID=29073 RepID=A0A8M1FDI4_URSMA|nr:uncharacterized protein LOC103677455 [Ursus maritimus]